MVFAAEFDPQSTAVILAAIAAGVWTIWLMIRQTRSSFREAVRDELGTHYQDVTAPAMHKIDEKVDKIQAQVETNGGASLKDAIVRIEEKADQAVVRADEARDAAVKASGTSNANAARLVARLDTIDATLAEADGKVEGVITRMDELHAKYLDDTAVQDAKIAQALEAKEQ